jgi:hypothetical protein
MVVWGVKDKNVPGDSLLSRTHSFGWAGAVTGALLLLSMCTTRQFDEVDRAGDASAHSDGGSSSGGSGGAEAGGRGAATASGGDGPEGGAATGGTSAVISCGPTAATGAGGAAPLHPLLTVWHFDVPEERFKASIGSGTMKAWDPSVSNWSTRIKYATASSFNLPMLDNCPSRSIMRLPAFAPEEGLLVTHNAPPNGAYESEGETSNYTLVWDALWPNASDARWRALLQTDTSNTGDAELYVQNKPSGGIGIASEYHGTVTPDLWHRIVVVVVASEGAGSLRKFIDGSLVGEHEATLLPIAQRWALAPKFLLFADDGYETALVYIANFAFLGAALSDEEVGAMGGPSAVGPVVPAP